MLYTCKAFRGSATHALAGGIGSHEFPESLFQIQQFAVEPIVFNVANNGFGKYVVRVVVSANLFRQHSVTGFCLSVCHQNDSKTKYPPWRTIKSFAVSAGTSISATHEFFVKSGIKTRLGEEFTV